MKAEQLSLFDTEPAPVTRIGALSEIALVYTTTEKANSSGIRFATSIADAKKFCSDNRTRGVVHGTQWAFMWTKASTWIQVLSDTENPVIDLKGMRDDGSRDQLISELGVSKIDLADFPEVFTPLGVQVKNAPRKIPAYKTGAV